MRSPALCLLAFAACSSATPSTPTAADAALAGDAAMPVLATEVTKRAAKSICGALFRCCDDDLVDYFAPYRDNELLAAFRERLPPTAALDEPGCEAIVEDMLDIVPLGDWVKRANAGDVTFEPAKFDACIAALDQATCGAEARAALWDSTCVGFAPPAGGTAQRSFFQRTKTSGAACQPIRDGIGAAFYGSCDPAAAFCCFEVPGREGCQFPYDADGNARTGTCRPTAATGQACSPAAPVKLCATGSDCDGDTLKCVMGTEAPLAVGAVCIDAGYFLLGTCVDSFCDVLGTKRCETPRANGQTCSTAEECQSGRCKGTCVPMDICTGMTPTAPTDGESCTSAHDIVAASAPSPAAGFAQRATGVFGATNDYNPLKSSGLQPNCSVVYDASGRDVVYRVTLQPGNVFRARLTLADGKQAALYALNACPAATWPDSDMSGACGSNEYNVGFCNVVGCDPASLTFSNPANGTAVTLWIVVDQVGGATSTGFTLDWRVD